jgi:hypothetical protein
LSALLFRLVNLLKFQQTIGPSRTLQPVSAPTDRANEVEPEVVDVRLSRDCVKFGAAADAFPHGQSVRLAACGVKP